MTKLKRVDTTVAQVRPMDGLRLRVRFPDGVEGEADHADLAGPGVFSVWETPGVWEDIRLEDDTLAWVSAAPTEWLDIR